MAGNATPALLLVLLAFSAGTPSARDSPCPTHSDVKLPGGTVRGEWQSADGVAGPFCFASFHRIPYAEPPTGNRRFMAPVTPPSPWFNYTTLQKAPVVCPQFTFPAGHLVGEEDCLYLNVFTTQPMSSGGDSMPMPVMVYIHGGGFTYGSGDIKENGPDFIVSNNVVLVTFNYRLGPLGFLSMDTDDLPGNNGLKDQQAALLWVKENIHLFGGDPDKITIFGNSAGAASCHFHTLNKESNSLIHGAILQSGTAIAGWAYTEDHLRRARLLAHNFGAPRDASPEEISRFLRAVNPLDLIVGALNITKTDLILKVTSVPPFVPSPEKRAINSDSAQPIFMDRDPEDQMLKLSVDPVPMILGINKDEGIFAFYYTGMAQNPMAVEIANKNLEFLLPPTLVPHADTAKSYGVSKEIDPVKMAVAVKAVREAYSHGRGFDDKNKTTFIKYLGDIFTANDVHRLASLYQYHNKQVPLYMYQFDVQGDYNFGKKILSVTTPGVTHTDELGYLFRVSEPDLQQDPVSDSISGESLRFLTLSWAEFARKQSPVSLYSRFWSPVVGPPSTLKPFLYIGGDRIEQVNLTMPEPWDRLYTMFRTPGTKADDGDKP